MKKIIAFDLDGTITPSKSAVSERMASLLIKLLDKFEVCIISGGKFEQFDKQLLRKLRANSLQLKKLHIMPTCGTQYYQFKNNKEKWEKVYSEDFTDEQKNKIIAALNKGLDELCYREKKVYGEVIEDRSSQITLSALGQDIVDILGEEGVRLKEQWDPDNSKKQKLREFVSNIIPEFEVKVGGLSSVDVTKPGIDKAYGMKKLMEITKTNKQDILFIGDRLQEGGNDYPVVAFGIEGIEISSWQETALVIETILFVL